MKSLLTIELNSTELDKQLSHVELYEVERIIYQRIRNLMNLDAKFREVDSVITQSFWLIVKPHFIHFDLDIRIMSESSGLNFLDQFNGPITFFYTEDDFLLAKELYFLQHYKTYVRNNVTL